MNLLFVFALVLCSFMVFADDDFEKHWANHKSSHKISFKSSQHYLKSKQNFLKNTQKVKNHNLKFSEGKTSFTLKLNHLSHLDADGIKKRKGLKHKKKNGTNPIKRTLVAFTDLTQTNQKITAYKFQCTQGYVAPAEWDWTTRGFNTPVRDQGQCGSCWAFAAVAALDAAYKLQKNVNMVTSPQQLVDCARDFGNEGCDGGLPHEAYEYIALNPSKAIVAERDYPYVEADDSCKDTSYSTKYPIKSFMIIDQTNENCLIEALVTKGPVAIGVDCSADTFQSYHTGVWTGEDSYGQSCSDQPDHAMLLVGYGIDKATGKKFWKIKNQWGPGWGDNGYIKLERNGRGKCGILSLATIPILA